MGAITDWVGAMGSMRAFVLQADLVSVLFDASLLTGLLLLALGLLIERLADVRISIPRFFEPYRLVNVVLLLRDADPYAVPLELLVHLADFKDPEGRAEALRRLADLVKSEDIADGFYDVGGESWSPRRLAWQAMKQYREESALAGIEFKVLNARGKHLGRTEIPQEDGRQSVFLLGLSASVQGLRQFPRAHDLASELAGLLRAVAAGGGGDDSYLCVWFSPLHGESLSREDGEAMFDRVLASTI